LFNTSLFTNQEQKESMISDSSDIIFVSDAFISDYVGGAELSSEALIESCPFKIQKVYSHEVTLELLESGVDRLWIFGNFSNLNMNLVPTIVGNLKYSVIEYDYKYCKYRSPEKHKTIEDTNCNCNNDMQGKLISAFYYGAISLWWMSEQQMEKYHALFPFLKEKTNTVLSSIFDENFFSYIASLREKYKNTKRSGWTIIGSTSWIKGVDDAKEFCDKNNLKYDVVWGLPHKELLEKLAQSEGLVFLPKGGDTCPRVVIEAKLLGCKLHINDNVQHGKELWFDTDDMIDTESYLYAARNRFWKGIKYSTNYVPTISGYTTTLNCIDQNYPFIESIKSMLGFCDEVVVVDGGSSDGTWEMLDGLSKDDDRLVIHKEAKDWDHDRFAVYDGAQKALARSLCTKLFCWQQDSDEIVHEDDYVKVKHLIDNFPKDLELLALPVIEYWGGPEKVRVDVNPWKWRLSKNLPHITHGIPAALRKYDDNGELYSAVGSDGCDYIRNSDFSPIKFATFYTPDVDKVRNMSFSDSNARDSYEKWFNYAANQYPSVHHYSWFDISRKIKTYRDYWSKHWQSLYDITQEDISENNMFFDKPWSKVTNDDINNMSQKLGSEMGGWIFHSKVDFSKPTPHVTLETEHPDMIKSWIDNLTGKQ
jgi:glycosyltransferase involved in cell wall biosynthesis